MRGFDRVLRALDRTTKGEEPGLGLAVASGLVVSAPVARLFLAFDDEPMFLVLALGLGLIAFLCTTSGTLMALKADTTAKAVGWAFVTNVVPPAVVCAPSIYGVVFSIPAGLIAFCVVLPMVLLGRAGAGPGRESRRQLVGALFASAMAVALVYAEGIAAQDYYPRQSGLERLPLTFVALTAVVLAVGTAGRDLFRLWMWREVARGSLPGLRAEPSGRWAGTIVRHEDVGQGPLRTAPTHECVGRISASPARAVSGVLTSLAALVVAGCAAWAWTLEQAPSPY